jgi:hypothetical protein
MAVCLALPGAAHADPFGTPQTLARGASDAELAVAPNGLAAAAWLTVDDQSDPNGIELSVAPPGGGGFGLARNIATGKVGNPRVAVSPNGAVIVAWTSWGGGLTARVLEPDGTLSAEQVLVGLDHQALQPAVAVDSQGNALVAWVEDPYIQDGGRIRAAWRPAGGSFQPAADVAAMTFPSGPSVAFVHPGQGVVAFSAAPAGATNQEPRPAQIAYGAVGGAFGVVRRLPGAELFSSTPSLAPDGHGRLLAAWSNHAPGPTFGTSAIWAARLDSAGQMEARQLDGNIGSAPSVAVGPTGRVLVAWDRPGWEVMGAVSDAASLYFTPFAPDTAEPVGVVPAAAVDAKGNAVIAWSHTFRSATLTDRGSGETRYVLVRAGATRPCATHVLTSALAGPPQVALDAEGHGWASWFESPSVLRVVPYDANGVDCRPPDPAPVATQPLTVAGRATATRTGRVSFRVRCRLAPHCSGRLELRRRGERSILARGRFSARSGRATAARLRLGPRGRALLRRGHRLRARLTARVRVAGQPGRRATYSVTISPARR